MHMKELSQIAAQFWATPLVYQKILESMSYFFNNTYVVLIKKNNIKISWKSIVVKKVALSGF